MPSWCDGPLLGFDLETTGVDPFTDVPVSYALVDVEHGMIVETRAGIVDPGRDVPAEAAAVHGITTEQARAEGEDAEGALERIAGELVQASRRGVPLVGMNVRFDLTMVDAGLRRAGGPGLRARGWRGPVLDLLVLDRHVDPFRKGSRRLGDLCHRYRVELTAAHDAVADVEATIRCMLVMADEWCELVDHDVRSLHVAQVEWYREWAVSYSAWRVERGGSPFAAHEYEWPVARCQ